MQNSLSIYGIEETKETVEQSIAIRLIPWLLVLAGAFSLVIWTIPIALSNLFKGYTSLLGFLVVILASFVYFLFRYHFAGQIKRGDMRSIWIVRAYCVYLILGALNAHLSSNELLYSLDWVVSGLTSVYILYGLFAYEKEIMKDGKSFKA